MAGTAEHASTTKHDFSKSPVAMVPFTVKLKNCMLETPVKFTWNWDSSKSHSSSSIELIGTCAETIELGPSEETHVSLEALVTEAGVHDLQNLSIVVHQGAEDEVYHPTDQWLIHLVDSS